MKKVKLGYIGSGPISNFHIPALKAAGFQIINYYSRNYKKALKFSKVYSIPLPEISLNKFIKKSKKCEAFILSIKTSVTPRYLEKLSKLQKPIFVEKPGALHSKDLISIKKKIIKPKIYFLYNRRFYKSVLIGKNFINRSKQCFTSIKIPEAIKTIYQFKINSCHILDLLFYFFGNLSLIYSLRLKNNLGYYFVLKSSKGFISCLLNWGSPQNTEINIYNENNHRIELKPLEDLYLYKTMKKIRPTIKFPIRTYIPRLQEKVSTIPKNFIFKPGFLLQYLEIKKILNNKLKNKTNLCTLDQAIKVLSLIEKIINNAKK
jgi:hypothetical protein